VLVFACPVALVTSACARLPVVHIAPTVYKNMLWRFSPREQRAFVAWWHRLLGRREGPVDIAVDRGNLGFDQGWPAANSVLSTRVNSRHGCRGRWYKVPQRILTVCLSITWAWTSR
jgi:hypothetical protein